MLRDFDFDSFLLVRPGNNRSIEASSSAALRPNRMMWLSPNKDSLMRCLLQDEEQEMAPKRQQRSNDWIENDFLRLKRPGFDSNQFQKVREIAGVAKDYWSSVVDSRGFNPDEVNIQLEGNIVKMSGNSEWKSSDGTHKRSRTFSQAFTVPEDVKLDTLQTKMLENGLMVVYAKREKKEEEKRALRDIPIQRIENQNGSATEKNAANKEQVSTGEE